MSGTYTPIKQQLLREQRRAATIALTAVTILAGLVAGLCSRRVRALAATTAAIALAAASASAVPAEQVLAPPSSCETRWEAKYRFAHPVSCEEQALASRGSGAPADSATTAATPTEAHTFPGLAARARRSARTAVTATPVRSIDSGFDWASAAAGAGVTAGLLALAWLAAMAASRRSRLRTAR